MPRGTRGGGGRTHRSQAPRPAGREEPLPKVDLVALRGRLVEIVTPVVSGLGYDMEELQVSRAGRRHVVRVTVDGDDGVNLDAVADVARAVSAALDDAEQTGGEFAPGGYTLEVSSPGVDRPLVTERHWRRNIGRLVQTRAAGRQLTGRVTAVADQTVTLATETGETVVPLADLGQGKVQIEFSRLAELDEDDMIDFTDGHEEAEEDER